GEDVSAAKTLKVRDPDHDPAIRAGFFALGTALNQPFGNVGNTFYLLWSVERVGVAYGLKTIGRLDWYAKGSEILLATQQADGSWRGEYAEGGADTCFALLFLRRTNLARDLSFSLRGKRDPGEVSLRSVGAGAENVQGSRGPKPGIASEGGRPDSRG